MSLRITGPQLKLPINIPNGSMPLQCNTYFQELFAERSSDIILGVVLSSLLIFISFTENISGEFVRLVPSFSYFSPLEATRSKTSNT